MSELTLGSAGSGLSEQHATEKGATENEMVESRAAQRASGENSSPAIETEQKQACPEVGPGSAAASVALRHTSSKGWRKSSPSMEERPCERSRTRRKKPELRNGSQRAIHNECERVRTQKITFSLETLQTRLTLIGLSCNSMANTLRSTIEHITGVSQHLGSIMSESRARVSIPHHMHSIPSCSDYIEHAASDASRALPRYRG